MRADKKAKFRRGSRGITRRDFIVATAATAGSILVSGCGGGSLFGGGGGGGGITRRKRSLAVNSEKFTIADDEGYAISFLGSFTDNGIQAALWGTQKGTGEADDLRQALVWDVDASLGARTRFDGRGAPAQIIDQSTGVFMTCHWEDHAAVFKLYQSSGAFVGGARVTATPHYAFQQLGDSAIVGYFSGVLNDTTEGIFAFTVGGVQTPEGHHDMTARKSRAATPTPTSTPTPQRYRELIDAFKTAASGIDLPPIAKSLVGEIAQEYSEKGQSALFREILNRALANTGLSGLFPNDGRLLLRGLIASELLGRVLIQFAAEDPATLVANGSLVTAMTSPGFTDYIGKELLPEADPTQDRTLVSGIAVSRDFGVVPLYGYIDSSGRVLADGTNSDGLEVELVGTVQGDTITGTWTSTPSGRAPGGGSFNGNQQPLGECQQQQLSGGQGTFTNSYDLHECGNFPFSYEAFTIPDRFIVLNGQTQLLDTGSISGGRTASLHVAGASTIVVVIVIASLNGTAWNYTVGCPGD